MHPTMKFCNCLGSSRPHLLARLWCFVVGAIVAGAAGVATAQKPYDAVRQWGLNYFDTESRRMPVIDVAADGYNTAVVRADGRAFLQGQDVDQKCRVPAGHFFTGIDFSYGYAVGLRSDGTVVGWGGHYSIVQPVPALPAGMVYTGVAAGYVHLTLLRSDGQIVVSGHNSYGQQNVPVLPAGVTCLKVEAAENHSVALLSNGTIVAWGDNGFGQCTVPPPPPGRIYTDVSTGNKNGAGVLSDGSVVVWGDATWGQLVVPPLPGATFYQRVSVGREFVVATRSDGVLVAWGANWLGQCNVPTLPAGIVPTKVSAGSLCSIARLSDGSVVSWGDSGFFDHALPLPARHGLQQRPGDRFRGVATGRLHTIVLRADGTVEGYGNNVWNCCIVPPLQAGLRYERIRAGYYVSAAFRSDGEMVLWGYNWHGQCNAPVPPPGVRYIDVSTSPDHSMAVRSDGVAVGFGENFDGQCNPPPLPAGVGYVQAAAARFHTLLLRSDGRLAHAGWTGFGGWTNTIPLQAGPGLRYTDIGAGQNLVTALRSDGTVLVVGDSGPPTVPPPPLPWGTYYVDVDCDDFVVWLRRSDGQIVTAGLSGASRPENQPPVLDAGTSYLDLDAGLWNAAARVGPLCHYIGLHPGCAGSRPASRLVPRDTPRIGRTLEVTLFDLPNDVALMAMGFGRVTPFDLGALGMPGCELAVRVDAVVGLSGTGSQARFDLPIPDQASLLGLRFFHQALVLDLQAANPLGAVLSDAMEGIVGTP